MKQEKLMLALAMGLALGSAHAASPSVWNGGGSDENWSDAANWNGNVPVPGSTYDLEFGGTTGLGPVNDFAAGSAFRNITFDAGAGAFTLTRDSILLDGGITNNSTSLQSVNLPLQVAAVRTISSTPAGLSLNGAISGNGGLIFSGPGTATLGGNNTYTNETYVYNGILNLPTGASIKNAYYDIVGQIAGGSGVMNITGGILTNTEASGAYNFCVGHTGYGMVNMTDGIVQVNTVYIGYGNGVIGNVLLTGGEFYCGKGADYLCIGLDANSEPGTGVVTVNGGLLNHANVSNDPISMNNNADDEGELNLLSGTIDDTGGVISFGFNAAITSLGNGNGIVSLDGGNLLLNRFVNASKGFGSPAQDGEGSGNSYVNFNGATVTVTAPNTSISNPSLAFSSAFIPGLAAYVNGAFGNFAGGAVINVETAGQTAIANAALLAPTGNGVSTIAVVNGGSGYIGAPYVAISGDGVDATAIANMVDDGTGNGTLSVASITICNPGVNYTAASCSLNGLTPTAPATLGQVTLAANTSGGLTKNGAGALILNGANTYTGNTLVNAGELSVSTTATGGGDFTVADGAILGIVQDPTVSTLMASNITLGATTGAEMDLVLTNGNSSPVALSVGTLNLNGVNNLKVLGANFTVGRFPLIQYTTLNGDPGSLTNGVLTPPPGVIAKLVHNPANSSFDLVVSLVSTALTWSGTNVNNNVGVWDVATTTNWIGTSGSAQLFISGADVTFDDTAAGTTNVDVEGTVQPNSVTVNNSIKNYNFEGSGSLTGTLALTKSGSGSLTIGNTNIYVGSTTVSGGTLVVDGSLASSTTNSVTVDGGGTLTANGSLNTGTGGWAIGDTTGNGIVNINANSVLELNGGFVAGAASGANGAINISGGTFTNSQASLASNFQVGIAGYGGFNMSGGTVQINTFYVGGDTVAGDAGIGVATISGGSFYCGTNADYLLVGGVNGSTGVLTVDGGLLSHAHGNRTISVNNSGDATATVNLLSGTLDNTGGGISYGYNAGSGIGNGIVNLDGGNLLLNRFINKKQSGTTSTGNSYLNFNGATVTVTPSTLTSPSVSFSSDFLPVLTAVYVNGPFGSYAGGAVIDTAGQNAIVDASLLAPTGQGVSTIAVTSKGSGYIGAPLVSITGDGTGATAIANMVDDGTGKGTFSVASITVCNPGVNYTTASCSLSGPSSTSAAALGQVTLAANTSGGLTKDGAGVLVLNGTNNYTGSTVINVGTLTVNGVLDPASAVNVTGGSLDGNGVINGLVNVQAGGALAPRGTLTINNTLNLASGSQTFMNVSAVGNTNDLVQGVAMLNYGGTLVISNTAGTLTPGQTFTLFNAAAFANNFTAVQSVPAGVTWDFDPTNGVATVVSVAVTTPTSIGYTVSGNTLSLTWPSSYLGWYVQSNSVSITDSNAWVDVPNSQLGTNFDISIDPTMTNVFYRLRSP